MTDSRLAVECFCYSAVWTPLRHPYTRLADTKGRRRTDTHHGRSMFCEYTMYRKNGNQSTIVHDGSTDEVKRLGACTCYLGACRVSDVQRFASTSSAYFLLLYCTNYKNV